MTTEFTAREIDAVAAAELAANLREGTTPLPRSGALATAVLNEVDVRWLE